MRMTQHLLYRAQIRAVFQQMRGKTVAQGVGRDILFYSGLLLVGFHDLPEALAAHPLPVHVHEQRALVRRGDHIRADKFDIILQRFQRGGIYRDGTNAVTPAAVDDAGSQVHIGDIQADELRDTDARGIQQLQHGLVAIALAVRPLRLLQQQFDLFGRQDLRQLVAGLFGHEAPGGLLPDLPDHLQPGIEVFQRRDVPRNRGDRFPRCTQVIDIGAQRILIRLRICHAVLFEAFPKLAYVAHVRAEGIL